MVLSGWVYRRRDHGGLIFADLRDFYGMTQVVFDPNHVDKGVFSEAEGLRSEYVIKIEGKIRLRPDGQANKALETGEIEVLVDSMEVLNESDVLPFVIDQEEEVGEDIRLKYRYLDLRRQRMRNNVVNRYRIIKFMRDFLDSEDFLEVETPMMIKGTPEGSREYLVPSRIHPAKFYVLPQSPQQLKQMLMISGIDKYFQIARCFRDEDLRGDRQPEFTQLDMEMCFTDTEQVMNINEKLATNLVAKFRPDVKIMHEPFLRMTYEEAISIYGSDKPDVRFDLKLVDVSDIVKECGFKVFSGTVENGGVVKALCVPGGAKYSRKEIDHFEEIAKIYGAKGLAYVINSREEGLKSPITKFFKEEELAELVKTTGCNPGDIMFFSADEKETACVSLGSVRLAIGRKEGLIDDGVFAFVWVTDFPLFKVDSETGQLASTHHPFTAPKDDDIQFLETEPLKAESLAYDLVLNGNEIAGGSIRIHKQETQSKVFNALKISKDEVNSRFGHLLKAFTFGAPPHGGIAWGLDRFVMIMQNEPNIREVIPFPKDQKCRDLMLDAPSNMPEDTISELNIKLIES